MPSEFNYFDLLDDPLGEKREEFFKKAGFGSVPKVIEFGKENTSADEKTETKSETEVEKEQVDDDNEADDEGPVYVIKHVTRYGNRGGRGGYRGLWGRRHAGSYRDSRSGRGRRD